MLYCEQCSRSCVCIKKRKKTELSDSSVSQTNSSIDNTSLNANANEPESSTKVMAYAMANLNSLNDHTYLSPSKTGCYTNPQPTTVDNLPLGLNHHH
jgi:hypothetical protein